MCCSLLDTTRQQLPHYPLGEGDQSPFVSVTGTGEFIETSSKRKKYLEGVQQELRDLKLVMIDLLHVFKSLLNKSTFML